MPTKIEKDSVTGRETTGHEWDGLKELNTPLPKWWLWTFYASIAFAVVWMVLYPSLPFWRGTTGWVAREAIVGEVAEANARNAPMMARLRAATPAQIVADPEMRAFALAGGRVAFANNCAACHGAGGQGAPGGFVYTWLDDVDLAPGTTYYYWLEDIDVNGAATRHGPMSVDFVAPTAVTLDGMSADAGAAPAAASWAWVVLGAVVALAASVRRRVW